MVSSCDGKLVVALVLSAFAVTRVPAEWNLWPSPTDDAEVVDQSQLLATDSVWSEPVACDPLPADHCPTDSITLCGAVGQQFVPTIDSLYRIDVRLEDRWDTRPGTFRLWRWDTDRATTVKACPLFKDVLSMGGGIYPRLFSVFPRVSVTPGRMYYFEISAEGRDVIPIQMSESATDAYAPGDGKAWVRGRFRDEGTHRYDLWFKTYGPPRGSPVGPTLAPSNPSSAWTAPLPGCSVITPGCPGHQEACPGSSDRRYSSNAYSKCDYYKRAKAYADYVACDRKSCGKPAGQEALVYAVLYEDSCRRGSCDESLAEEAIAEMIERYDYQFCRHDQAPCQAECGCDLKSGTDWFEWIGAAYRLIRSSPRLSPADRRRIQCVMVDSAQKFWPRRESGAGNRPLAAATMLLLTADNAEPFSEASECREVRYTQAERDTWREFAEANWNTFWSARSWGSDSSSYVDNLSLRLVLRYAYFSGRDSLVWSDAGFRVLVDNLYRQFSPLGVGGNFGENAGFAEQQSALVWFFEKAAHEYGEPKYKWLAHQIYRYNDTRQCDEPPAHESFVNGISDLAMAYLEADDSISDATPDAQTEALGSHQTTSDAGSVKGTRLGQTFTLSESPLARLDLRLLGNGGKASSATIKIWPWKDTYDETIAQAPLFQDSVPMSAIGVDLTFYPFLDLKQGTYFVEVGRSRRPFTLASSQASPPLDAYTEGDAYVQGGELHGVDLWFKAWSLSPNGSTYTTRRAVTHHPPGQWSAPCPTTAEPCERPHDYGAAVIPDKLMLRSGYRPTDLFAMFTLTMNGFDHGDWNPAALSLLTGGGSVLLAETPFPYWNVAPRSTIDNTESQVKRYWGGSYGAPRESVAVTRFADSRNATVAWIDWSDVHGWGVLQQRRLFFVKGRFLWVRDRFTFPARMGVAVGTTWHAGDVAPNPGTSWYDLYYRQPLGNQFEQRNPEGYVTLNFIKRGAEDVAAFREATYDPPKACASVLHDACETLPYDPKLDCRSGPPFVVDHRWKGMVSAKDVRYMDAILFPHGAPAGVAPPIQAPLYDDGRNVAIRVIYGGDEEWTLVDNPDGITIYGNGVTTDARYLITRTRPGSASYVLTYDATKVVVGPHINMSWRVRTSVEIGGD